MNAPIQAVCTSCNVVLAAVQKRAATSALGIVGALVMTLGLLVLFLFHVVGDLVTLAVGLLINMAGAKTITVMTCPQCGTVVKKLPS